MRPNAPSNAHCENPPVRYLDPSEGAVQRNHVRGRRESRKAADGIYILLPPPDFGIWPLQAAAGFPQRRVILGRFWVILLSPEMAFSVSNGNANFPNFAPCKVPAGRLRRCQKMAHRLHRRAFEIRPLQAARDILNPTEILARPRVTHRSPKMGLLVSNLEWDLAGFRAISCPRADGRVAGLGAWGEASKMAPERRHS